jgi:hypothetical protein
MACTLCPKTRTRRIKRPTRENLHPLNQQTSSDMTEQFRISIPTTKKSWKSLTPLSHAGRRLARPTLRLYFFSNRSCCWGVNLLKSGGQIFFVRYGLLNATTVDFVVLVAAAAARLIEVGNIVGCRLRVLTQGPLDEAGGELSIPDIGHASGLRQEQSYSPGRGRAPVNQELCAPPSPPTSRPV